MPDILWDIQDIEPTYLSRVSGLARLTLTLTLTLSLTLAAVMRVASQRMVCGKFVCMCGPTPYMCTTHVGMYIRVSLASQRLSLNLTWSWAYYTRVGWNFVDVGLIRSEICPGACA